MTLTATDINKHFSRIVNKNKIEMERKDTFYICPICKRPIKNKQANLRRHMELHKKKHERFECNRCEKDFQNKNNLKRHLMNDHKDNDFSAVKTEQKDAKSEYSLLVIDIVLKHVIMIFIF